MEPPERSSSSSRCDNRHSSRNRHLTHRKRKPERVKRKDADPSAQRPHRLRIPEAAFDPIMERYVQFWFGRDSKTYNDAGITPIMEAAREGDEASVAVLLNLRKKILRDDGQDIAIVGVPESSNGWTALHYAVCHKNVKIARLLLDVLGKFLVNVQDKLGRTPLHFAAAVGYGMVHLLCEHGANVNIRDHEGQTPLATALAKGYNVNAEKLLEHGADANMSDHKKHSPLHKVIKQNDCRMVSLLCQNGANVNVQDDEGRTPLFLSLVEGDNLNAMELLDNGADPNIRDSKGRHTLHSMKHCNYRMVSLLCKNGANVDTQNESGKTLLLAALSAGDKVIAMELLDHGADPNLCDAEGRHPLLNIKNNDYRMVNLLCKHGANVNAQDHAGKTLLFNALSEGDNAIAMELLEHGADPNIVDYEGRHPLHNIKRNDYRMAGLLCEKGANVNTQDKSGRTPLFVALSAGENAIAMELLARGADPNITTKHGEHALHNIERNDYKLIGLLCAHGAVVNVRDCKGRTPLFVALSAGENAIAMELLEHGADPNLVDWNGIHPLHSVKRFDRRLMEILREHGASATLAAGL